MKSVSRKILTIIIPCLPLLSAQATAQPYAADWKSLRNYQVPEWYQDAKFGIWPHWGVYSVPEYRGDCAAEWYGRFMHCVEKGPDIRPKKGDPSTIINKFYDSRGLKTAQHHLDTYGSPAKFSYHDFIPMWKAEKFDADEWAQMAVDAGAKFFTMMAQHHDSFSLYDSEHTEWDSVDKGPKRDLCREMKEAVTKRGLKFGVSNHMAWNSTFFAFYHSNGYAKLPGHEKYKDLYSAGVTDEAYMERWWKRTTEAVDKLQPDLYYFDWGWHAEPWTGGNYRAKFAAYLYNRAIEQGKGKPGSPGVVMCSKNSADPSDAFVRDLERGRMSDIRPNVWQTDTSISVHSWGYSTDDEYFSTDFLVDQLIDIVSKNGVLMLNFGPRADGSVPAEYKDRLLGMGRWLKANGEAIYATRPWNVAGEGPTESADEHSDVHYGPRDLRYTRSKDGKTLYATALAWPGSTLTLLSAKVLNASTDAKVTMLANGRDIPFQVDKTRRLVLDLTGIDAASAGCEHAYAFRIGGFQIEGVKLTSLKRSELYMHDTDGYEPKSDAYPSRYPYLSGLDSLYDIAHRGVKRDHNYGGQGIQIGGKKYDRGLMVCPDGGDGLGIFLIGTSKLPGIKRFTADIGIDDAMTQTGSSAFLIEAYVEEKWKRIFKSHVLTTRNDAVKVDVEIPPGTKFLRFITTDGGNGCSADHAVWAEAKFH